MTIPFVTAIEHRTERTVWTGQNGNGIPNDCGPAAIRGFLTWLGRAPALTVSDIARATDAPRFDGTTARDCGEYLRRQGLTPVYGAACKAAPFVALVQYNRLPVANRLDKSGRTFPHWITVTAMGAGGVTYNDPYHPDAAHGASLRMTLLELAHAEQGTVYRWSVAERPLPVVDEGSGGGAEVVTEQVYIQPETNIRASRSTASSANILGESAKTWLAVQAVRESAPVEGFAWWRIALQPVWPAGLFAAEKQRPDVKVAYVRADRVRKSVPVTPPPVVTPPTPPPTDEFGGTVIGKHPALPALRTLEERVGVHLLEMGQPEMDDYIRDGCKSFTAMNNVAAARRAREVGAAIFRKFMAHGILVDAREHVLSMGLHRSDTLMVMGINEADNISTSEIRRRFEWDRKFAEAVWEFLPNCFPVIGSFSMGTPQLENPDVALEWRETYGRFLNANWQRVGLNYHCYSGRPEASYPPSGAPVIAPEWFEERHLHYAYHPSFGALDRRVVLVGDESGVDVAGWGGFPACGYDDNQRDKWWALRKSIFAAHPQMYAQNLFQGDWRNERWRGYNVSDMRGWMSRAIWNAQRKTVPARPAATRESLVTESAPASPLPADWSPAPKVMG